MGAKAVACMVSLLRAPGIPACGSAAIVHQLYAVHRTDWNTQLTARAMLGHHGMHVLVGAQNGVGRAGFDAQRAAYAPGLINDGQLAWCFLTILGAQRLGCMTGDGRKQGNALGATWRALINGGIAAGDGLSVAAAVGVAASSALRLRQGGVNTRHQLVQAGWRALVLTHKILLKDWQSAV